MCGCRVVGHREVRGGSCKKGKPTEVLRMLERYHSYVVVF